MKTKQANCNTTVGLFSTYEAAERAVEELRRAGYRDDQIGLISKDDTGKAVKRDGSGAADTYACEGATTGAAVGAAAGAGVGIAIIEGLIPGVGPILAFGTLATVLLATAGGAAGASLVGALIGWGIPEDEAAYYEGRVSAGQHLVTVECGQGDDARDILARHRGYDRRTAPDSSPTSVA